MTTETKHELWVGRMADYAASGLSRKQWCAQHDVALHLFAYWRHRLNGAGVKSVPSGAAPSGWCAVQLGSGSKKAGLSVCVGGASILVEPGFDANLLKAVVEALGQGSLGGGGA